MTELDFIETEYQPENMPELIQYEEEDNEALNHLNEAYSDSIIYNSLSQLEEDLASTKVEGLRMTESVRTEDGREWKGALHRNEGYFWDRVPFLKDKQISVLFPPKTVRKFESETDQGIDAVKWLDEGLGFEIDEPKEVTSSHYGQDYETARAVPASSMAIYSTEAVSDENIEAFLYDLGDAIKDLSSLIR